MLYHTCECVHANTQWHGCITLASHMQCFFDCIESELVCQMMTGNSVSLRLPMQSLCALCCYCSLKWGAEWGTSEPPIAIVCMAVPTFFLAYNCGLCGVLVSQMTFGCTHCLPCLDCSRSISKPCLSVVLPLLFHIHWWVQLRLPTQVCLGVFLLFISLLNSK